MLGAILSVRTDYANYGLWIYDPIDVVNHSGLDHPFSEGVTIRANVELPVSIGGLEGHQGFAALYSTYKGTDLENPGFELPSLPVGTPNTKSERYYFAYSFDQTLFRRGGNSKEGIGLFGQFGISDGNPTRLHWSALAGISGHGMIPGRRDDNWGLAYYYDTISPHLIDAVAPAITITNESGFEAFYNWSIAPWVTLGADVQVINPGLSSSRNVFLGLRLVTRF
jgi:porin